MITISLSIMLSMLAISSGKNLAKKLGYSPDAKLLIIHADNVGIYHITNEATIKALEKRVVVRQFIAVVVKGL